jgi:hypothetical protein
MNKEHQAETGEGNAPRMNWAHHRGGKTVVTDSAEDRPFAKAGAMKKRFQIICVPTEDDSPGFWFVYDMQNGKSVECESFTHACDTSKIANMRGHLARRNGGAQ